MALMRFHAARTESRLDARGRDHPASRPGPGRWDRRLIAKATLFMNLAAFGDSLTRYHLEAAIAYEHCAARTFSETNWERILQYYALAVRRFPVTICRAERRRGGSLRPRAAERRWPRGEIEDREQAGEVLPLPQPPRRDRSAAEPGASAADYFAAALALTASEPERRLLRGKIAASGAAR